MNKSDRWLRIFLGPWALIPSVLLALAAYVFAGLVAMSAEDFDRPMTVMENLLVALALIPVAWILAIIARFCLSWWRARQRDGS